MPLPTAPKPKVKPEANQHSEPTSQGNQYVSGPNATNGYDEIIDPDPSDPGSSNGNENSDTVMTGISGTSEYQRLGLRPTVTAPTANAYEPLQYET